MLSLQRTAALEGLVKGPSEHWGSSLECTGTRIRACSIDSSVSA